MSPTITVASLFSWRFSREKRPTLTVATFFLSFFCQTTDLIAYVPLFTDFTLAHMYSSVLGLQRTQRSRVRVLALARNFFEQFFSALCDSFNFFSALCDFFRFFLSPKGPPSSFLIFCSKLKFQTAQKVFTILGTFRFLSLRYSADFRRSRLVKAMN